VPKTKNKDSKSNDKIQEKEEEKRKIVPRKCPLHVSRFESVANDCHVDNETQANDEVTNV
jgi:hypothetical protein